MTEQEFMTGCDPAAMLRHFSLTSTVAHHKMPSDRKLRLWVEACREAGKVRFFEYDLEHPEGLTAAVMAYSTGPHDHLSLTTRANLLREIVGNPFRPVPKDEVFPCVYWRRKSGWGPMATALQIAEAAYDEQDWGRLPVLADAMEEAGCAHYEILTHLRGPNTHVRGCWAVDAILGHV